MSNSKMVMPLSLISEDDEGLKIVHKAEPIDPWFGMDIYQLNDEDIEALKNGKCLYGDNYEYAILLYYRGDE